MAMGTGKSRVAITAALRHRLSPVLILCPRRVVEVWREQFARFAPDFVFLALDDRAGTVADKTAAGRERLAWCAAKSRPLAIAINYEAAYREPFAHWSLANIWPLVIADEAHRLKQASGAISRFAGRLGLRARYRLGLTGTPMPHSPLDVWAQFRFLDRTVYDPTYTSFKLRHAVMDPWFRNQIQQWRDLDELREKFFSLAFQVGNEVLDLPGEREQTLYCTLTPAGARLYQDLERDLIAWIEATPAVVVAANALVRLLRLQQITSGSVTDTQGEERAVDDSKAELLRDLLEDLPAGEPVVVFAVFRADLATIHRVAAALGRKSGELSGTRDDLKRWQRGGDADPVILAVQIQAGGVGIDLTRAAYAAYFSLGFNLADYLQSRARLYRAGQSRPVMFYHLAVQGSVDEAVLRALARRQNLVQSVLAELTTDRRREEL
jgi:SNF2 family DNA or RNA helicase